MSAYFQRQWNYVNVWESSIIPEQYLSLRTSLEMKSSLRLHQAQSFLRRRERERSTSVIHAMSEQSPHQYGNIISATEHDTSLTTHAALSSVCIKYTRYINTESQWACYTRWHCFIACHAMLFEYRKCVCRAVKSLVVSYCTVLGEWWTSLVLEQNHLAWYVTLR